MRSLYLDHNATTPVRPEVVEAMAACLAGPAGNPSSRHRGGRAAEALREEARERIARAAGCAPRDVVFTSGGTEADNLALRGLTRDPARRHVVTAATEHEAILHTVEALRAEGVETTILPVDAEGRVDPEDVARALRPDTALVTLMMANNETGVLGPVREVGALCRERGVPFHTDAVNAFGKVPVRLDELPVDLASISAHKIGGPKGVGALLLPSGLSPHPTQTGGGQERRIRPGTENLPGIVGFGQAAESAAAALPGEAERLAALRDRLETAIRAARPEVRIAGAGVPRLPNTSNVAFPGVDGDSLLIALDLEGIAVSTGAACASGASEPSHVLRAMGRTREEARGSLRVSLGFTTTADDVEEFLGILPGIVERVERAEGPR